MTDSSFQPSEKILQRYAEVLINFALNSGEGVKPGEVVHCAVPDVSKDLGLALQNTILKAGAHPMMRLLPSGWDRDFYSLASEEQLVFFPKEYLKAKINLITHHVGIIADVDPHELHGIDAKKIIKARDAKKEYRDWFVEKETHGKLTWTCALWGVPAKAAEVGLSLEEYWDQIIKACFLDYDDPVAEWRKLNKTQMEIKKTLNDMSIEKVRVVGPDVDLEVKLGADRVWNAGSGRNIPSFEFFTSPDWRGTNGWIKFNQPLYRYGNVLKGIALEFKDGVVIKATAEQGEEFLNEMIKSPNANKVGEFSLTDKRMSRITHVMAETLFDENISGPFGNTHIALGMAYKDCFRGDPSQLSKEDWEVRGFNDSAEHTDIISTTDRTVTATLSSGEEIILYKDGQFAFYKGEVL